MKEVVLDGMLPGKMMREVQSQSYFPIKVKHKNDKVMLRDRTSADIFALGILFGGEAMSEE